MENHLWKSGFWTQDDAGARGSISWTGGIGETEGYCQLENLGAEASMSTVASAGEGHEMAFGKF